MKAIGGYFGLELNNGDEYHSSAIRLNTGRNALEYILRVRKYEKIYLPYYTCKVVLEPMKKLNVDYDFYSLGKDLLPKTKVKLASNEVIVLNNYFGILDDKIKEVISQYKNVIIDNSQAFFAKPNERVDCFYSARKFFGVPDGAYLYCDNKIGYELEKDISIERFTHLIGRIEMGAEKYYKDFMQNDDNLINQPIKEMSNITNRLLCNINYDEVKRARQNNFKYLQEKLKYINEIDTNINEFQIPMCYPLLIENGKYIKKSLITKKIFVPTFWPNVADWASDNTFEYYLTENLICLPIDQRYGNKTMKKLIKNLEVM